MKPHKILIFLAVIFLILLEISFIFPKNGIKISEQFTLQFPSISSVFSSKKVEYADLSKIIPKSYIEKVKNDTFDIHIIKHDSIIVTPNTVPVKKKKVIKNIQQTVNADSLRFSLQKLEFPNGNKSILYPIFKELSSVKDNNDLIRILHYGDSQIEGDRITSLIRNKLQTNFGGIGPGLVSATTENNFALTLKHEYSNNWKLHRPFGKGRERIDNKRYGILMQYSTYTNTQKDTNEYSAWIKLETTKISYYKTRKYKQCMMLYRNTEKPVTVNIFDEDSLIISEELKISNDLNIAYWNFIDSPKNLEIQFKGQGTPEIYAFSLDGLNGVAVDNIPMRGSSGLEFTKTDLSFLQNSIIRLGVKMVIVEFGVNVVPSVFSNYRYYQIGIYNQLMALKKMIPNLPIVVIGLSDMSKKVGDNYMSYTNIELIRNAQKKAAFKANCAFWDMYEAMGGENSMPSWVFAKPALAEKDFTHFNHRGSKIIAEMFYNSFMYEYNNYVKEYNMMMK